MTAPAVLPLVSVITPALNAERTLRTTLTSLLAAEYPRHLLEVLVVDNGSADGTCRIAAEFPVRLLRAARVRNAYVARNAGIRAAGGTVLAFTDADCRIDPAWIRTGVAALERTGCPFAAGRVEFDFPRGLTTAGIADAILHMDNERWVRSRGFGVTANLFVRAGVMQEMGGFAEDLPSGGDFRFCADAAARGFAITYVPAAVVHHPVRSFGELLAKRVAIGGMHARWPGRGTASPLGAAVRLLPSFLPPRPAFIRARIRRRGTPEMERRLAAVWAVTWLCGLTSSLAALRSLLRDPN